MRNYTYKITVNIWTDVVQVHQVKQMYCPSTKFLIAKIGSWKFDSLIIFGPNSSGNCYCIYLVKAQKSSSQVSVGVWSGLRKFTVRHIFMQWYWVAKVCTFFIIIGRMAFMSGKEITSRFLSEWYFAHETKQSVEHTVCNHSTSLYPYDLIELPLS